MVGPGWARNRHEGESAQLRLVLACFSFRLSLQGQCLSAFSQHRAFDSLSLAR